MRRTTCLPALEIFHVFDFGLHPKLQECICAKSALMKYILHVDPAYHEYIRDMQGQHTPNTSSIRPYKHVLELPHSSYMHLPSSMRRSSVRWLLPVSETLAPAYSSVQGKQSHQVRCFPITGLWERRLLFQDQVGSINCMMIVSQLFPAHITASGRLLAQRSLVNFDRPSKHPPNSVSYMCQAQTLTLVA